MTSKFDEKTILAILEEINHEKYDDTEYSENFDRDSVLTVLHNMGIDYTNITKLCLINSLDKVTKNILDIYNVDLDMKEIYPLALQHNKLFLIPQKFLNNYKNKYSNLGAYGSLPDIFKNLPENENNMLVLCKNAILHNRKNVITALSEEKNFPVEKIVEYALSKGKHELIKDLLSNSNLNYTLRGECYLKMNDMKSFENILENNQDLITDFTALLCRYGRLDLLQKYKTTYFYREHIIEAIEYKQTEVEEFLLKYFENGENPDEPINNWEFAEECITAAIKSEDFERVKKYCDLGLRGIDHGNDTPILEKEDFLSCYKSCEKKVKDKEFLKKVKEYILGL